MRPFVVPPLLSVGIDKICLLLMYLYLAKTGLGEIVRKLCVVAPFSDARAQRKLIALMIGRKLLPIPARERVAVSRDADAKLSAGAQDAEKLSERLFKLGKEENRKSTEDSIKGSVREIELLGIHLAHAGLRYLAALNLCACFPNHSLGKINPDYLAAWPHLSRRRKKIRPSTSPDIQDVRAFSDAHLFHKLPPHVGEVVWPNASKGRSNAMIQICDGCFLLFVCAHWGFPFDVL